MLLRLLRSDFVISLALFILALLPRLLDPGRFLTPDEFLWVDRSRNFLLGLLDPAYQCTSVIVNWNLVAEGLACTLRTGHPGVTTMWTGSFGLWLSWLANNRYITLPDYLVRLSTNPLDPTLIVPTRIGTILITSFWVVAVYWLVRRLWGAKLALISAVMIALDPFHIALSRVIHHDALSTTFMTLSVLAAFVYWGQRQSRKWLLASGALAGFAILSKSPALYLLPFIAVVGLWFWVEEASRKKFGRTILDGLLWFAAVVAVIIIFWPAMWVAPREAIETVLFIGSKYATGGHAKGNFFLGQISQDPGHLFYPVTWLYRTSPLVMIGVIAALILWPWRGRIGSPTQNTPTKNGGQTVTLRVSGPEATSRDFFNYLPLILIFILGYYLLMTIGEKKQDRYFLPVYPWLNLIAAAGLVSIINYHLPLTTYQLPLTNYHFTFFALPIKHYTLHITHYVLRFTFYVLLLLILITNGYLVAANFPYYFTYYNPWLGGIQGAAKALTIGWGEGLDIAADYLNHGGAPSQTRVSSWYESTFAPFYYGSSISYSKEKGKALAGDYVIFYINQTQRRFPDDIMFDYFESRFSPVRVVTLHGLDYAWIYPSLGIDHYVQDQVYTGIASLLAWQWSLGDRPLTPDGSEIGFELYWEYLGKRPDEPFFFRLVDAQQRPWVEGSSQPRGNPPFEQWREGEIIYETGTLRLPPGLPPGQYQLQIGFYTQAPAVTSGELLFPLPPAESLITVGHYAPSSFYPPTPAISARAKLGDFLTLIGAALPQEPLAPGAKIPLDLYWQINQPLPATTTLHIGLMDEQGQAQQAWFDLSLAETFNPAETTWQPGDIVHTRWELELLPETPPGHYTFDFVWPDDTKQVLSLGQIEIEK
jgi:4-amino-4-deoxy-L-arabinose transferase-like glycosyltransferase